MKLPLGEGWGEGTFSQKMTSKRNNLFGYLGEILKTQSIYFMNYKIALESCHPVDRYTVFIYQYELESRAI
jgi:hypothetical protein